MKLCKHRRIILHGNEETGLRFVECGRCGETLTREWVGGEAIYIKASLARRINRAAAAVPLVYLCLTVNEALPVLTHVDLTPAQIAAGPHYSPGSRWLQPWSPKIERFVEFQAAGLRKAGYTVTVTKEAH